MTALAPYWSSEDVTLYLGKCERVLPDLPAESVDAIVTDPPAAIAFMGRSWDSDRGGRDKWVGWLADCMEKAARVLKPGGHLLVWSLPRTSHWTAWALEDAGLEIRDCVLHLYGSGFPKSLDVSKAIDKAGPQERRIRYPDFGRYYAAKRTAAGLSHAQVCAAIGAHGETNHGGASSNWETGLTLPTAAQWDALRPLLGIDGDRAQWPMSVRKEYEREVIGVRKASPGVAFTSTGPAELHITAPATEGAARWEGFGTALKPGQEMWWLARKPLAAGTVAANVLQFGTGALNIDACKVATAEDTSRRQERDFRGDLRGVPWSGSESHPVTGGGADGRWPTNIVLTHSAACEPIGLHEVRSDGHHPAARGTGGLGTSGHAGQDGLTERKSGSEVVERWACAPDCPVGELDRQSGVSRSSGGPSGRLGGEGIYGDFQHTARTHEGGLGDTGGASRFYPTFRYQAKAPASERPRLEDGTAHETVKSLDLTRWQVRLLCPPGGTVLDMFGGSGPVPEACIIEGFRCIVIEQEPKSAELIVTRLAKPIQPTMLTVDDSAPPARPHPVAAASRPKPPPEAHPSLFDLEAS